MPIFRASLGGVLCAALVHFAASAEQARPTSGQPRPFPLTVDSVMRGPALVGYPPGGLRWTGDSKDLYFDWRQPGEDEASTWVVARDGKTPRKLTDDEKLDAPPATGAWDTAHRRVAFARDGDIVVIDTVDRRRIQVTRTSDTEANPRWTRQDTHLTFTRDNHVFIVPVVGAGTGVVMQLADIGAKKNEAKDTDSQKFLKAEEVALIDAVREAADRRKLAEERKKRAAPPRIDLGERQTVADALLSPDERYLYLLVAEKSREAKTANVPNYVTESAYTEDIATRIKVGDAQEDRRLAIFDATTQKIAWADLATAYADGRQPAAPLGPGADAPGAEAVKSVAAGLAKQTIRWALPIVSPDGKQTVAVARGAINNDRWIVAIDPTTGACRVLDHLYDAAWVRELSGPDGARLMGFVSGSGTVWFLSERDGWMHLYTVDAAATAPKSTQLTSGAWEITDVSPSPDGKMFYLTSTEASPYERQVYTMPVGGGTRTRLTTERGSHDVTVSPDGAVVADVYSSGNQPPDIYFAASAAATTLTRVTTSTSDDWRAHAWLDPKVISFKARDGVMVPARIYTPEMVGVKRDPLRPAVIFVHGAGYLQNVHHFWSSYYREYMFHHVLASRGYVVLDVDYRGSAGHGRDWRTAIYRYMGGKDLDDIVDGARYLASAERVDPKRIGVYGGSYGGFITLMAMFTSPGTFAAGAALRPVTDWAHYNHPYTANILNEPPTDADAYRRSSPIYFADKLQGALLICHGMVDTNVHFQDSVRLAQRLIELRKDNWELAVYPVENHGFERETSWADEYKRILLLFERNLRGQTMLPVLSPGSGGGQKATTSPQPRGEAR